MLHMESSQFVQQILMYVQHTWLKLLHEAIFYRLFVAIFRIFINFASM